MNLPSNKTNEKQTVLPLFHLEDKKVELSYSGEKISSNGGALLLRETEGQIGIIKQLSQCIEDTRDQRYVQHSIFDLVMQRVLQIACGYEDGNDCNTLKDDPILKLCTDKMPTDDNALASQPTMSRFENSIGRSGLYRIAQCFADAFIDSYAEEPPVIIIDCDDTNNNTHGAQQMILYNQYYGEYCYMPLHIYEGQSGKLITTILKPGRRSKSIDVLTILKRLITHLRKQWKNTVIIVRGDSHFCSAPLMDWAETQPKTNFLTGLSGNKVLARQVETSLKSAQRSFEAKGKPVKIYHQFIYQANSWKHPQRVIAKVEVTKMGSNIRYVVTDMHQIRTKQLYENGYCARGKAELNIKDHKTYLKSDRSSCKEFEANQMRLFLHSAAYVLLHALRENVLKNTEFSNATMETIRLKLVKVAAHVTVLKTKIKIVLPRCCPVKAVSLQCYSIFQQLKAPPVLTG